MSSEAPQLLFQRELREEMIVEARKMFESHWQEVGRNKETIPLEPDDAFYEALEKQGKLRVYTVRDRYTYELLGYAVYFVSHHAHYKSYKWAVSDIFWLKPKARATRGFMSRMFRRAKYWVNPHLIKTSTGTRLFDFIETQLKNEGVNVMHTTYKTAHPAAGRVLKYLGHTHIEHGYSKVLNVARRG